MQGLTEPIFEYSNFTEPKSPEVCTVLQEKGLVLKNRTTLATKLSVWTSSTLKSVDLEYRSSLSVAWMIRFWFKSLQNLTAHKRQLVQGNVFLPHEVPFYLCSIFCIRVVRSDSALRVIAFLLLATVPLPLF